MVVLSSFCFPESPIRYEQRNIRAVLDKKNLGLGTLYVSESTLSWKEQEGQGFSLAYPHISLHAVARDANVYPRECIFILIDAHVHMPGDSPERPEATDNSDSESEETNVSELLLVPADPAVLVTIYEALNICQALNPDPEDVEEDDDDDVIFEDAEEDNGERAHINSTLGDVGAGGDTEMQNMTNRLQNSISITYYSNGDQQNSDEQFEDAD